jgi:Lar family restriction alleviation protein
MTTRLEPVDLLPCPFCGGGGHVLHRDLDDESMVSGFHLGLCDNCETQGPPKATHTEAIAAWNRRAAPAPDGMREAIAGPAAWLNRWAAHVGNCTGGTECTCGLWLAQFEMEKALAIIAKGEGR